MQGEREGGDGRLPMCREDMVEMCECVCMCVCLSECEGGRKKVVIARIGLVGHFLLWLFPVEVNGASVQTWRNRQTDTQVDRHKNRQV